MSSDDYTRLPCGSRAVYTASKFAEMTGQDVDSVRERALQGELAVRSGSKLRIEGTELCRHLGHGHLGTEGVR